MYVNGDPMGGVNVSVTSTDGGKAKFTQRTAKNGFFHFWLQPGNYELEISAYDYVTQTAKFYVSSKMFFRKFEN